MRRNWTTVGEEYVERLGREDVEKEIAALDWQEIPAGGSLTVGFMPGYGINEVIAQLDLPKRVSRIAISAFERPAPTPDEDGFYPGFYGIETSYSNGLCRVYVLDLGTELTPLASDFWDRDGGEVEKVTKAGTELWDLVREEAVA